MLSAEYNTTGASKDKSLTGRPPLSPRSSVLSPRLIGIIIATRWEAAPVLRAFGFRRVGSGLYRARLKDRDVLLCLSGIGPKRAREAAVRLCQAGVKELVSAGFCGALSSDLRVGDLLTDRVVSSPVPVRTKEERRTLAQRANARAVDMETQAIVEAGTRLGVPIRVLRVVSDLYEDDLTALFGSDTRISPWRIALRLIRPRAWPLAWRLHRQSEAAKAALLSAFERFFSDHP